MITETIVMHKQETNRAQECSLWKIEVETMTKEELASYKKSLMDKYDLHEENGDYLIYSPAVVRIYKNYP